MSDLQNTPTTPQTESTPLPKQNPQPATMLSYSYVPPVPRKWKFAEHDVIFALLGLPLGFLFVRYVLFKVDGFVTTAFFALLLIFCAIYLRRSGYKLRPAHHALGGLLGCFTLVFSLTASPILHGLCATFLLIAIPWWTRAVAINCGFVSRFLPFDLLDAVFAYPLTEYGATVHAISNAAKKSKNGRNLRLILLGLFITLPLTGVVAMLLSSADAGISRLFSEIASRLTEDIAAIIWQLFLGIFAACWLFGMLYGAANLKLHPTIETQDYENRLSRLRLIPNLGLYAGVTPICLLYLLYFVSQTHYFCSAFFGQLPANMESYAQYARRGFFELCAIAIINLGVILLLTGCAQHGGKHRPKILTCYASLLCGLTLFIITTAIAKMFLYIDAYGLTQLRLFTAWFMLMLGIMFIVLLVRQFRCLPVAKVMTTVFLVFFGILCFARPDALIAHYNIRAYEKGVLRELDVEMLCDLSEDAYLVILEHTDTIREANKGTQLEKALLSRYASYQRTPEKCWNLSAMWLRYGYQLPEDTASEAQTRSEVLPTMYSISLITENDYDFNTVSCDIMDADGYVLSNHHATFQNGTANFLFFPEDDWDAQNLQVKFYVYSSAVLSNFQRTNILPLEWNPSGTYAFYLAGDSDMGFTIDNLSLENPVRGGAVS